MTAPDLTGEREKFEDYVKQRHGIGAVERNAYGQYIDDYICDEWDGWQARAALSPPSRRVPPAMEDAMQEDLDGCYGQGLPVPQPSQPAVKCPRCNGSGKVRHISHGSANATTVEHICPVCGGTGAHYLAHAHAPAQGAVLTDLEAYQVECMMRDAIMIPKEIAENGTQAEKLQAILNTLIRERAEAVAIIARLTRAGDGA